MNGGEDHRPERRYAAAQDRRAALPPVAAPQNIDVVDEDDGVVDHHAGQAA